MALSNLDLIVLSLPKKDELAFKSRVRNKNLKKNINTVDTTVKLIGDSHVKGLSEHILPLIPPTTIVDFSASGGATTEQVNQDLNIHTSDLTNNDFLISISGNDINFTKDGKCIGINIYEDDKKNVLSQCSHTNVLILSTPYRYDIKEANYYIDLLNDETEKNIVKANVNNNLFQNRIRYQEINSFLDRSCYGRSGIHLTIKGKQILSEAIMREIKNFPKGIQAPQIWDLIDANENLTTEQEPEKPEIQDLEEDEERFGLYD
ncbi:Amine sulfotransferase [Frankliniella fusca]|uniref:Amine sulfotransferase n=1 Tax=Frankliniella fusca TaxID=407009 RepID=A0AAE1LJ90_9NEOP|nr:Amine sulfotransferase [Frankliniella fusca]